MTVCIPIGIALMSSSRPAIRAAAQASSIPRFELPVMFEKMLPAIGRPVCRTTPIWRRTDCTARPARSWPSK